MRYVIAALLAAAALAGCASRSSTAPAAPAESAGCQQAIATVKAVLVLSPAGLSGTSLRAYQGDLAAAVRQCPKGDPGVRSVTLSPAQLAQAQ